MVKRTANRHEQGGTVYEHAVTVARSRSIDGPYEVHPENPVLTSVHEPELALQKAGHASFVETQLGDWYLAHLCGRPLEKSGISDRHCNLGRETAIQPLIWGAWSDAVYRLFEHEPRPVSNLSREHFNKWPVSSQSMTLPIGCICGLVATKNSAVR